MGANWSIILKVGPWLLKLAKDQWINLTYRKETSEKLRIANIKELVETGDKHQNNSIKIIQQKIMLYEQLGIPKEEIAEKLLPEIENCMDPISVLKHHIDSGRIIGIHDTRSADTTDQPQIGDEEPTKSVTLKPLPRHPPQLKKKGRNTSRERGSAG